MAVPGAPIQSSPAVFFFQAEDGIRDHCVTGVQTCALPISHEPPIIHRDIKPQNLKLTDENHVILLDFGLSKNSAALPQSNDSGSSTGSTGRDRKSVV